MSCARSLCPLLSAGAALALALAGPGTALADSGSGGPRGGQSPGSSAPGAHGSDQGAPGRGHGAQGAADSGAADKGSEDRRSADPGPAGKGSEDRRSADPGPAGKGSEGKGPAQPARPAQQAPSGAAKRSGQERGPAPAQQQDAQPRGAEPSERADADPAGNNGTIKIDTVPGDAARANRPHPGCAFVLQFFDFDAGERADIVFTGQAPTRSAGPLLTLSDRLISTSPADGALEEGHSLTLTAADLGLLGTPTAAKGWHVKVAVDALAAPGGAKQKVFWLDCASGGAAVQEEADEADVDGAAGTSAGATTQPGAAAGTRSSGEQAAAEAKLAGEAVGVLSEGASRQESAGVAAADLTGTAQAGTVTQARQDGRSVSSALGSVLPFAAPAALPFTGAAGTMALLAAGLGSVAAGVLAVRAGRRRTTAQSAEVC